MLNARITLFALLLGCFAEATAGEAIRIEFTAGEGWLFEALPDGSVHGQYGSLPGDAILLPKGSVDFAELVAFVSRFQAAGAGVGIHAAIRHKGEVSVTLNPLTDDSLFRNIFSTHKDDWRGWLGDKPSERVIKLMRTITYYKASNQAMQRTAGRSAFQLLMTSTLSQQPHAPSLGSHPSSRLPWCDWCLTHSRRIVSPTIAVADLVSR